jgi:kinesin family protein 6/9
LVLLSRLHFWDLPGSEILTEDPEATRIRQGSTLNKVITAVAQLLKELGQRQSEFVPYDTSTVTHLMKESFGNNALNVVLFLCQHGDPKGSSLTLNMLKYAMKI